MKYTKIDAEMEVARLRQCAKNARESAWRADRTADMRAGMAEADKLERRAAELEELYVSED